MKSLCKSLMLGLVVGVMTLMPIGKAFAQSPPEPAVVVSIAKFKEQMDDVNYLLTASGFAEMKFMAGAMIKGYTKGLDSNKDAGVLLYFNEGEQTPDFLAFVPVANMDDMLDVVAGMAEVEEGDDFTVIVPDNGPEVFLKERDGFALISNKKDVINNFSGSPDQLLGDLPSKYNLAARVMAQKIPMELRDQVMGMIRDASEDTMENMDDGPQLELQRKNLEMQMQQLETVMKETDTFVLGMNADADGNSLVMDVDFTGVPGSKLAKQLAETPGKNASRFTGFLMEGAAFTNNQCINVSAEDAATYSQLMDDAKSTMISEMDLDGDMSEAELAKVEGAIGNMVDVLKATLAEGTIDGGMVVTLDDGNMNIAAGAQVAEPKKVEDTVKELVPMLQEKFGSELEVNLNSGSHKDVTFHELVLQIPDGEEEMRDTFGDQITIVVGIGSKEVYLGGGSNPEELLKKVMDSTGKAEHMMQYNVYVTPILKFAANMEGDPSLEAMATALAESGKDRISITSNVIDNGIRTRFEMQDGILSLIKVAMAGMQGGFPGADDDF